MKPVLPQNVAGWPQELLLWALSMYPPPPPPTRLQPASELGLQVWSEPEAHSVSIAQLGESPTLQTADTRFPCRTQGPKLPLVTKTHTFQKLQKRHPSVQRTFT